MPGIIVDVKNVVGHLLVVLISGVLQRGVDSQIFRGFRGDLVLAEQRAAL